jgi:hypothetical protein
LGSRRLRGVIARWPAAAFWCESVRADFYRSLEPMPRSAVDAQGEKTDRLRDVSRWMSAAIAEFSLFRR